MFLGIDTCTRWLNLALVSGGGEIVGGFHEEAATHTTLLAPALERLLREAGAAPGEIEALGVVAGPGSFTGLRVGLAAALGFSQALGIPLYGLPSLDALARACPVEGTGLALLDARRSEVFCQRFAKANGVTEPHGELLAIRPECLTREALSVEWAAGTGVPLVPEWPQGVRHFPEVPNLGVQAALEALKARGEGRAAEPVRPLYVRAPDARKPVC